MYTFASMLYVMKKLKYQFRIPPKSSSDTVNFGSQT